MPTVGIVLITMDQLILTKLLKPELIKRQIFKLFEPCTDKTMNFLLSRIDLLS